MGSLHPGFNHIWVNIDAVKDICCGALGLTNEEEVGKALQDEIRVLFTIKSEEVEKIDEYLFVICVSLVKYHLLFCIITISLT